MKYGDQFSEIALAEEATRHKQLDVQLARTTLEKEKLEAKREKGRIKLELLKLKMTQEHERDMAALHAKWASRAPSVGTPTSAMRTGSRSQSVIPDPLAFFTAPSPDHPIASSSRMVTDESAGDVYEEAGHSSIAGSSGSPFFVDNFRAGLFPNGDDRGGGDLDGEYFTTNQ
ncbi:hypothetical protein C8Q76DRAFT_755819 [Earliella scabrosa]|nr:hypothetical protein C8Q76DRAFT_755819 [Earliella scabrosa]